MWWKSSRSGRRKEELGKTRILLDNHNPWNQADNWSLGKIRWPLHSRRDAHNAGPIFGSRKWISGLHFNALRVSNGSTSLSTTLIFGVFSRSGLHSFYAQLWARAA